MHMHSRIGVLASCALALSACSAQPRYFVAQLAEQPKDRAQFQSDLETCNKEFVRNYKADLGPRSAGAVLGGAASTGVVAAATPGLLTAAPLSGAAGTAASAGFAALPIVLAFGVSRLIRADREKKMKAGLADCLSEFGYKVDKWTPAPPPAKAPKAKAKA